MQPEQLNYDAIGKALFYNSNVGIHIIQQGRLVLVNEHFVNLIGYTVEQLVGKNSLDFVHPDDRETVSINATRALKGQLTEPYGLRFLARDGSVRYGMENMISISWCGKPAGLGLLLDITQQKKLEEQLSCSLEYQQAILENNAAGIFTVDQNRTITTVNKSFSDIYGYTPDEVIGRSAAIIHVDQAHYRSFASIFMNVRDGYEQMKTDYRFRRKDGRIIWCDIMGAKITDPTGQKGVIWSVIDITERREVERRIQYQALHDDLTDLPNRRALDLELTKAIARAARQGTVIAVGVLDLDDFKPVNDIFGHHAGDQLLREITWRLKSRLREVDFLARLGGDEFVLIFEGLDQANCQAKLATTLNRLHEAVESPFEPVQGKKAVVGMSLGMSLYPLDGQEGDTLLRQADVALNQIKSHKLDRTQWWQCGPADGDDSTRKERLDPYTRKAAEILGDIHIRQTVMRGADRFAGRFLAELKLDPQANAILSYLDAAQMNSFKTRVAEHLLFLSDPATTKTSVMNRGRHLGHTHVLTGVNGSLVTRASSLYRRLLFEELQSATLSERTRRQFLRILEGRLQDNIQADLEAEEATLEEYTKPLDAPRTRDTILRTNVFHQKIDKLGKLPGVLAALLIILNSRGVFAVDYGSGSHSAWLTALLRTPDFQTVLNSSQPGGQGLTARAWRTHRILSSPRAPDDLSPHSGLMGIRSQLSVPILDEAGRSVAVIALYGAYPNQFESPWMQQFALHIGRHWNRIGRTGDQESEVPALPQVVAATYREQLFAGGLSMHVQPVVDLETGQVVQVEALARLRLPDGQLVLPGDFLPLLGDAELNLLFCLGLDQALEQLACWDAQGLFLTASVNLPPSCMLDPDCTLWVKDSLRRHGILPHRLTLELLENQNIDPASQDLTIERINHLAGLGVKFALDDLGSGYASLLRLSLLPFDTIKVDQRLTTRMRAAPIQTLRIMGTLIKMGATLGQKVVVEGLEDNGIIEMASILGAHLGQGFGLARPMQAGNLAKWQADFRLPGTPKKIHTFCGALAYHSTFVDSGDESPALALPECPLTAFLAEKGLENSPAASWHAQMHADENVQTARQELLGWLAQQVSAGL